MASFSETLGLHDLVAWSQETTGLEQNRKSLDVCISYIKFAVVHKSEKKRTQNERADI